MNLEKTISTKITLNLATIQYFDWFTETIFILIKLLDIILKTIENLIAYMKTLENFQ